MGQIALGQIALGHRLLWVRLLWVRLQELTRFILELTRFILELPLVLMAPYPYGPLPLWPRARLAPNQLDDTNVPYTFNPPGEALIGGCGGL